MAANTKPIFPAVPYAAVANLTAITACTTKAPTATASLAAANIIQLVPTSTNGRKIDSIRIKAASSSITAPTAAQVVTIWYHDGTTAYPIDDITIEVVTPSTTAASFEKTTQYTDLVLPPGHSLYVSTTITTTASTTALIVKATGGDY